MGLKMGWIIIDTPGPAGLAPFWEQLLRRPRSNKSYYGINAPDPKVAKNRLHFDLVPDDQDAEVARAVHLGALRVDIRQGEDATQVVLADPEGNEFCILPSQPSA